MTWVGQSEFQNSYSINENFPYIKGFTFAFVTNYFKKKPSKNNYKKYIFIYLYTSKSWSLVFIVAILLLSKINSYIIHPFSTYSLSFFFFSFFLLISQIIVIISPTFSLPFTFSSSYYYLPYYPFGYCICIPRPTFHLFFFFFWEER